MNQTFRIPVMLTAFFLYLLIQSCVSKKERLFLETRDVTEISTTTSTCGGNITNKKGIELSSRGVCWSRNESPAIKDNHTNEGRGKGGYVSLLKGLLPGTTYFVRAYAIAGVDTIYGEIISFSTEGYGTVNDIEGNRYKTVKIGSQTWMTENLRTTRYNDSTIIRVIEENDAWAAQSAPACCWYKNSEEAFKSMYGTIYNWYAVNTGKLCPVGWHVPSKAEWDLLEEFLGGSATAGGILKETGDEFWQTPNTGATNQYRFSALPGGLRYLDGEFRDFGFGGYWWSSTELNEDRAYFRHIFYQDGSFFSFDNEKRNGFYVRCIKD
jgi:uncharacterized protein (TIGR02145 family)